jgi:hypothetical protein
MDGIEPAIWVDPFWQRRQGWQARKGDLRWTIAAGGPQVRSLLVVVPEEALGGLWHLTKRGGQADL